MGTSSLLATSHDSQQNPGQDLLERALQQYKAEDMNI